LSTKITRAAELLVDTRRRRAVIPDLPPQLRPADLAEAYAIQYAVARLFGPVGGWKVNLGHPGDEPKATPVPSSYTLASGARWSTPTRVEVELAVRVGSTLPARAIPYTSQETLQALSGAHIAFELLGARFVDRKTVSTPLTLLADGQANGALVHGAVIPDWPNIDLTSLDLVLTADGSVVATAKSGNSFERTLQGLTWLANHATQHTGGLEAGQFILTGARIGPITIDAGKEIAARCGNAAVTAYLD
jgi:2-keto-4-pentenoate hydratase